MFLIEYARLLALAATRSPDLETMTHGTDSIYLLAPTKYRALELAGDYLADAGRPDILQSGKFVVRQLDLSEEQILRPERCRACPLNE